jgi:lysophospholipase L1-like esterase
MPLLFPAHQRILFIGDSVTDSGRGGQFAPHGNGYVNQVWGYLTARYPERNLTVINRGVGGNTVRNLAARWEKDVIAERPTWVCVMIGINDVWRHFAYNAAEAVPLDEYQNTLRRLLQRVREIRANIILMQPYMVEPNKQVAMRQLMDVYGKTVALLATEFKAPLVRTQDAFDVVTRMHPPLVWATDQIHPTAAGHAVITQEFLRTVGYEL